MQNTGERQVSSDLEGIAPDHRQRYAYAGDILGVMNGKTSILDAACGIGYGSNIMARQGHTVTGIDISGEAIEFAREYYNFNGRTTFAEGDLANIKELFSGNIYDCVVSFETIEHVEDAESLIKEFAETSDILICSVPNQNVIPFDKKTNPFHFRHYTPEEFEILLTDAGYTKIEFSTQLDKWEGSVIPGDYGRTIIAVATK